jgi:phosphoglycolate phosphatase
MIDTPHTPPARLNGIALVVYDLDGTLVDSFMNIWSNVDHALRHFGLPALPFETVKAFVGDGVEMLVRRALDAAGAAPRFEEFFPYYCDYYLSHPDDHVSLYPGVERTLEALRAAGLQQAILTNKPDGVTQAACARLGLAARVDGVWGERQGQPRKPDPAALTYVMEQFGVAPGACAMVGDGPADIEVARAAGAAAIGVSWGQLGAEALRALAPDAVIEGMEQLPGLLGKG